MRRRLTSVAALLALVAGCESTGPGSKELGDFILDFCTSATPSFVAFQNEGGPWTRVTPDANGTVVMKTTPKFGLAVNGIDSETGPFVDVLYATRAELSSVNGMMCLEPFGTKTLNGSVAGVSPTQVAEGTLAASTITAPGTSPTFQFQNLPDRPADLVAHRQTGGGVQPPDRVIVRRAVNQTSGATLAPALDFSAAPPASEAAVVNTMTITGLVTGETNIYSSSFATLTGTDHAFFAALFNSTASTQNIYGVPASLTQSGDLHSVILISAPNSSGSARGVTHYYRTPGNRTVALGPTLNVPTINSAATSPSLRMRAQLASQSEYGGFASVNFNQSGPPSERNFSVTKTSGYVGSTPATWDLEMPDLTGVSGFPASALFVNGQATDWFIEAASTAPDVFLGAPGSDGLIVTFADRNGASPMIMKRMLGSSSRRSGRLVHSFLARQR